MFDSGVVGIFRYGDGQKTCRQFRQLITVRVPHLETRRQPFEQHRRIVLNGEQPFAVFALLAAFNFPAQKVREHLQAVADAEHRHAQIEDGLVRERRVFCVNAGRPTRQNQSRWLERGNFLRGCVVAKDGGIHITLANAARDDLCVLRAEVEDDDLFVHCKK
jgi:hypothetical protein